LFQTKIKLWEGSSAWSGRQRTALAIHTAALTAHIALGHSVALPILSGPADFVDQLVEFLRRVEPNHVLAKDSCHGSLILHLFSSEFTDHHQL
jgi:hypothetical protein